MSEISPYINDHGSWPIRDSTTAYELYLFVGSLSVLTPSCEADHNERRSRTLLEAGNMILCDLLAEPELFIGHLWMAHGLDIANAVTKQLFRVLAHCGRELDAELPNFDAIADGIEVR